MRILNPLMSKSMMGLIDAAEAEIHVQEVVADMGR